MEVKKNGYKGLICAVILILLIGLIGFGYYYKNKPEVIFKTTTSRVHKSLYIDDNVKSNKVDFDFLLNVDVSGNKELATEEVKKLVNVVNNLLFKFSLYNDLESNILNLGINTQYNKKELFNTSVYYENNKVYLDLKDLYDKIIYDEVEVDKDENKINVDDVKTILDEYFTGLEEALNKAKFETEKVNLNGSKVTKNKLIINSDNIKDVYKTLLDYLTNSDKFLKAFSNISGMKSDEIKETLGKEEIPKLEKSISINLYTKGFNNDVVKASIESGEKEILTMAQTSKDSYEMKLSSADFEFKCDIKSKDSKDAQMVCSTEVEKVKLGYTMNIKVDDNYKFEKPSIKADKLVKFSEMSEEDTNKIMEKLMGKDAVKELSEVVASLIEQMSVE